MAEVVFEGVGKPIVNDGSVVLDATGTPVKPVKNEAGVVTGAVGGLAVNNDPGVTSGAEGPPLNNDFFPGFGAGPKAGAAFPGFGPAPPIVAVASDAGVAGTASRSDHTHGDAAGGGTPDINSYRIQNRAAIGQTTGPQQDRIDMLGQWNWVGGTPSGNASVPVANRLFAIPFIVGQQRTVLTILNRQRGAAGVNGQLRWGIYANLGAGLYYPGNLIDQSPNIGPWNANISYEWSPVNLVLAAGLYWIVTIVDTAFEAEFHSFDFLPSNNGLGIGGVPSSLTAISVINDFLCLGWRQDFAFPAVTLPSPFPSTSPVILHHPQGGGAIYPTAYARWNP
jgi:hypothetical protein